MTLRGISPEIDHRVRNPGEYSEIKYVGAAVEAARLVGLVDEPGLSDFTESVKEDYLRIGELARGGIPFVQPNLGGSSASLLSLLESVNACEFAKGESISFALQGPLWDRHHTSVMSNSVINRLGEFEEFKTHLRIADQFGSSVNVIHQSIAFDSVLSHYATPKTVCDELRSNISTWQSKSAELDAHALNPAGFAMAILTMKILGVEHITAEKVIFPDQGRRKIDRVFGRLVVPVVSYNNSSNRLRYTHCKGSDSDSAGCVLTFGLRNEMIKSNSEGLE